MATYEELYNIRNNGDFHHKVEVAVIVKAQALLAGQLPTADQVAWASNALSSPAAMATKLMYFAFAANKDAMTSQILAASDTAIQTNVDAAADALINGGVTS